MKQRVWTVTPAKVAALIGDPDWPSYSDYDKAEAIATFLRAAVPGFLSRRFEYRVTPLGMSTEEGKELFVVESGWPEEFD